MSEEKRLNPFFEKYNTPHDTAPFNRIRLEDYEEAFMEASVVIMSRSTRLLTIPRNRPSIIPSSMLMTRKMGRTTMIC